MNNKVLGSQGEQAAADYLTRQGYRICARNFRVPAGEIDIVAAKQELVVFVEVKTRRGLGCGTPGEPVYGLHNAKCSPNEQALITGSRLMSQLAIDALKALNSGEDFSRKD